MFSSTVTVASAWLHLLAADLFAGRYVPDDPLTPLKICPNRFFSAFAFGSIHFSIDGKLRAGRLSCLLTVILHVLAQVRQIFLDGLNHNVETRHSLVLCLMMCPIGIFSHLITKVYN